MTTVARLPVDPGPAGWNKLLPAPQAAAVLHGETTADWLVIGAGFAGLSAAHRLAQLNPTDKVAVLDATRIGDGPAGRNSGFMIDLPHDLASDNYGGALDADLAQMADNRRAIAFAGDMAADFGLSDEAFVMSGKINGAATEKGHQHNVDFAEHLTAMGEPFELLDAAAMHAKTGTRYYKSGLFTPGSAMIQPALYIRGLADGIASNRVSIHENSPVTDLQRNGDWVATTPSGKVRAPRVILAVNGHLGSFGFMQRRLMHVFTYASMTRPLTENENQRLGGERIWGLTPADPLGTTVRKISGIGGTRLIIRNRFTYDPTLEVDGKRLKSVAADHLRAFDARFEMLKDVTMEHVWGGRLCLSLNNVQVIGELEPGLWSACCQNGLGTAKGTLAGMLAAEGACGVASPALDRALAAPKPTKLPPRPIAQIGAAARLRWGEWSAGAEL